MLHIFENSFDITCYSHQLTRTCGGKKLLLICRQRERNALKHCQAEQRAGQSLPGNPTGKHFRSSKSILLDQFLQSNIIFI